jgi:hypothetical protein
MSHFSERLYVFMRIKGLQYRYGKKGKAIPVTGSGGP